LSADDAFPALKSQVEFDDTKVLVRNRKSKKNKHYNSQLKKNKHYNSQLKKNKHYNSQLKKRQHDRRWSTKYRKLQVEQHKPH